MRWLPGKALLLAAEKHPLLWLTEKVSPTNLIMNFSLNYQHPSISARVKFSLRGTAVGWVLLLSAS
jgi:hypothetical protein